MAVSDAKKRANKKYDTKAYDYISFDVRKDSEINAEVIRAHAIKMGESLNKFYHRAVAETIQRDNTKD